MGVLDRLTGKKDKEKKVPEPPKPGDKTPRIDAVSGEEVIDIDQVDKELEKLLKLKEDHQKQQEVKEEKEKEKEKVAEEKTKTEVNEELKEEVSKEAPEATPQNPIQDYFIDNYNKSSSIFYDVLWGIFSELVQVKSLLRQLLEAKK